VVRSGNRLFQGNIVVAEIRKEEKNSQQPS